jgi:hypothetical protein
MSKKVKIYLIVFILAVALTFLLSSCDLILGYDPTDFESENFCCGAFGFIGAPLLMLKVINKKM